MNSSLGSLSRAKYERSVPDLVSDTMRNPNFDGTNSAVIVGASDGAALRVLVQNSVASELNSSVFI